MPDRPSVVRPRLGNVQSEWGYHNGQPALILRDALGLSPAAIALPQSLALLAALCDGTRDLAGLRASLMVRAGVLLSEEQLGGILAQMDEALLFENGRQGAALAERLAAYRAAPQRAPICAGGSYPADPAAASAALDSYAGAPLDLPRPAEELRGLVSPHIDYPRGGEVYAAVWRAAAPALAAADLVVILGTDHHGPPGSVTLTAQSYATPWGILPTDAGAVVHQTHTRQIDRLGGLAKGMPWTAACFVVGAAAICGLPPLNGFVSEWLVYLGMLRGVFATGGSALVAAGVPVLAAIGALAVACFVKVFGTVFLGEARTEAACRAGEAPAAMRLPMGVLAGACVLIGVAPLLVAPALDAASSGWLAGLEPERLRLAARVPLGWIGLLAPALLALGAGLALLARRRAAGARRGPTWDCGYALPTPRMQYTAASFARTIVQLSGSVLRPREQPPGVTGLFPPPTHAHSHVDDAVLDRVIVPAARRIEGGFSWFHRFHRGLSQHYLLYILVAMIVLLVWSLLGVNG